MSFTDSQMDPLSYLYESTSIEDLGQRFQTICHYYFVERFALATLLKTSEKTPSKNREFDCFDNYPPAWKDIYTSKKYYLHDPVFLNIKNLSQPQYWHIDHFKDVTLEQKAIPYECSDFDIKRGTTISLLPNSKYKGFLTLLGTDIYDPKVIYDLANAANIYLERENYFANKSKHPLLTARQREIMELKTKGYHNKQIATLMGISDKTVAFHLSCVREKYEVFTTEQALAKYYQELIDAD